MKLMILSLSTPESKITTGIFECKRSSTGVTNALRIQRRQHDPIHAPSHKIFDHLDLLIAIISRNGPFQITLIL